MRELRRWSGEYDAISDGRSYPAQAFVEWVEFNRSAAAATAGAVSLGG